MNIVPLTGFLAQLVREGLRGVTTAGAGETWSERQSTSTG